MCVCIPWFSLGLLTCILINRVNSIMRLETVRRVLTNESVRAEQVAGAGRAVTVQTGVLLQALDQTRKPRASGRRRYYFHWYSLMLFCDH